MRLGPGNVADVHQAVDALVDADEQAEVGDVLDAALDGGPHRVFLGDDDPRGCGSTLLHAQADALLFSGLMRQHHRLDLFAHAHHLGRVADLAGPGHLADVDQAFHAFVDLLECPVVGQAHHLAP